MIVHQSNNGRTESLLNLFRKFDYSISGGFDLPDISRDVELDSDYHTIRPGPRSTIDGSTILLILMKERVVIGRLGGNPYERLFGDFNLSLRRRLTRPKDIFLRTYNIVSGQISSFEKNRQDKIIEKRRSSSVTVTIKPLS